MEGRIFLFGGYDGTSVLSSMQVYYPSRERAGNPAWEDRAPLPEPRYAMGAATLANMIYIMGGESDTQPVGGLSPIQYLPVTNQWSRFDRAPQITGSKLALLALDTRLHIIGGEAPSGLSAEHLTYQAIYTISLPSVQN
jgi:N-acetylneuraminic acid mutarotase